MMAVTVLASGAGSYFDWGVIHVSVTNLMIIIAMIVVFVLALVIPFPRPGENRDENDRSRP